MTATDSNFVQAMAPWPSGLLTFSEPRDKICAALVKAQAEMGDVIKNAANPHLGNKYADLAAVLAACAPAYKAAGIAVLQPPSASYEGGGIVRVETLLLHETGQWARSEIAMKPTKTDPQSIGSAITYGRRYAMLALSGLAPEDDDANKASGADERRTSRATEGPDAVDPNQPLLEGQKRSIVSLVDAAKKTIKWHDLATKIACDKVSQNRADGTSATTIDELRFVEANEFMRRLRKAIKDGKDIPQPKAEASAAESPAAQTPASPAA